MLSSEFEVSSRQEPESSNREEKGEAHEPGTTPLETMVVI